MTTNSINTAFTNTYLAIMQRDFARVGVMIDGRPINLRAGHGAWTYHVDRNHWEFHGPDEFYWHGRADNAADARAHGWNAWLREKRPAEFETLDGLGTANPFMLALLDRCVKIRRADLRDPVRVIIYAAAQHAHDNVVFTDDRDEDDPEDDGGWLVDFHDTMSFESEKAPADVARWFKRHNSLRIVTPVYLQLHERCAQITDAELREQIRDVIAAAAENADEYDEPSGWEDAFRGSIETKCEDDVTAPVRKWFARHM